MKALVVGASRGIGLEFVRQFAGQGWAVTATARSGEGLERVRQQGARALLADVADATSLAGLAGGLGDELFDVAIVCAGLGSKLPALCAPDAAAFDRIMHTNVLGPMRLLPVLAERLVHGGKLAVLSSRLGSIGGRTEAGNWLYRSSKAALNSALKDVALALGERAVCVSLHPGWVRTDMGGEDAEVDVRDSVAGMRAVLESLAPADTGSFRDYSGRVVPW